MRRDVFFLAVFYFLTGCSALKGNTERFTPSTFPVLSAIGYAPIDTQPSKSRAEKVLMAMTSSKILAYRELAEQVYGLQLDANAEIKDLLVKANITNSKVSGLIKGARVVKSYPVDQFYVTELELDFRLVWELYQQADEPHQERILVIEPAQNF